MTSASSDARHSAGGKLLSPGFLGLLATQFLTAVNDNIFRWLVIGIGKDHVDEYAKQHGSGTWLSEGNVLMAGTACFVLPYLVLAAPSGYLADKFRKRDVIVACKLAEIVIMLLGAGAILLGHLSSPLALALLFGVLMLMGAQAALFSPARSGSIPEVLHPNYISKANGLFGLATVVATVIGMAIGCALADFTGHKGMENVGASAAVLIGIAILGMLTSLAVTGLPAGDPSRKFPWDAPVQTFRDLHQLASNLPMLRVAVGIAFFYAIGALAQLNIDQLAAEGGAAGDTSKLPLLISLIIGVCVGSVLAGIWSGDHVELGILPLGAFGMAAGSLLLFTVPKDLFNGTAAASGGVVWACALLFFLGGSAGLFSVPLEAFIQHRSPRASRGSILAASNFLTFGGILISSLIFAGLRAPFWKSGAAIDPLLNARQIFLLAGLLTIPVFVYIVWLIPQASLRFFAWLLSHTIYRIRVFGRENLPREGGALLVPNHVTWVDALFLMLVSSRPIRMIALATNLENKWLKRLSDLFGVIPIVPTRPKTVIQAFRTAREALNKGELVCIFPEGGLTRTGQVQAFMPGMMKILEGTSVPVVPIYLDGLWGSIFSFDDEKFFWKWPRQLPYPLSIHIGSPVADPSDVHRIRQAVLEVGAEAVQQRTRHNMQLITRSFIRQAKSRKRKSKVADSTGADLTGGEALMRSLIARRLLRRHVFAKGEQIVGVLLPPSVPAFVINMALALDKRISVNLNYTVTPDVMNQCLELAGIKHVLTSRKFIEKMPDFAGINAELVYLEDLRDDPKKGPTLLDKAAGWIGANLCPAGLLEASLGLGSVKPDDVLTIIFTSGSTGTPKGVMLSYANIGHNVDAIDQVIHLRDSDVLVGILPFFHSFGYTVTLWGVAGLDIKGAYHFSPLDARQIGKVTHKHKGTLLLATPTFLRTYLRRCEKAEFASLDVVVAGAEKLPKDLSDAFEQKFGVRPVEGYGTTELSPLVSVNIPPSRSIDNFQKDRKEGSVGRPMPGVTAKVTNLDTGSECKAGEPGMLWIKGPNVMKGYMHRDDLTEQVIKEGWYQTGDIAFIDDEGFIHITGRESRFSKIGGEMVPHIKIEEILCQLVGGSEEAAPEIAVTAVPDDKKGERLIVLHTKLDKSVEELRKGLSAAGLPNLFIPSADSFIEVESIPILGTGKLDLRALKKLALEKVAVEVG
ncbi:MAG TPA: acyl-[ACP]--phospholipid O-acyltransferase [Pirellulaceae bacterium]|nr:acyl-[ACP]--phospholipid O-acyltransferase [Pirellulaceae bacterium]